MAHLSRLKEASGLHDGDEVTHLTMQRPILLSFSILMRGTF
jgi:hypothetical protein